MCCFPCRPCAGAMRPFPSCSVLVCFRRRVPLLCLSRWFLMSLCRPHQSLLNLLMPNLLRRPCSPLARSIRHLFLRFQRFCCLLCLFFLEPLLSLPKCLIDCLPHEQQSLRANRSHPGPNLRYPPRGNRPHQNQAP